VSISLSFVYKKGHVNSVNKLSIVQASSSPLGEYNKTSFLLSRNPGKMGRRIFQLFSLVARNADPNPRASHEGCKF
jgi:hypothetical protein